MDGRSNSLSLAHSVATKLASHFGLSQSWIVYASPFIRNDLARHSLEQVVESWVRKLTESTNVQV